MQCRCDVCYSNAMDILYDRERDLEMEKGGTNETVPTRASECKKVGRGSGGLLTYPRLFDHSKAHFPDMRHRALLHSSFGIYIVKRVFGTTINSVLARWCKTGHWGAACD